MGGTSVGNGQPVCDKAPDLTCNARRKMTNDEARMTKEIRSPNDEFAVEFDFRH